MTNERSVVYPGSFCPPTIGHMDIVERVALQYDKVYWAVGHNPLKTNHWFDVDERLEMMQQIVDDAGIDNIVVDSYVGVTIEYAVQKGCQAIIRGLRGTVDLAEEMDYATANRGILVDIRERLGVTKEELPHIESIPFLCKPTYKNFSSSRVRELANLGLTPPADENSEFTFKYSIDQYVHPFVAEKVRARAIDLYLK